MRPGWDTAYRARPCLTRAAIGAGLVLQLTALYSFVINRQRSSLSDVIKVTSDSDKVRSGSFRFHTDPSITENASYGFQFNDEKALAGVSDLVQRHETEYTQGLPAAGACQGQPALDVDPLFRDLVGRSQSSCSRVMIYSPDSKGIGAVFNNRAIPMFLLALAAQRTFLWGRNPMYFINPRVCPERSILCLINQTAPCAVEQPMVPSEVIDLGDTYFGKQRVWEDFCGQFWSSEPVSTKVLIGIESSWILSRLEKGVIRPLYESCMAANSITNDCSRFSSGNPAILHWLYIQGARYLFSPRAALLEGMDARIGLPPQYISVQIRTGKRFGWGDPRMPAFPDEVVARAIAASRYFGIPKVYFNIDWLELSERVAKEFSNHGITAIYSPPSHFPSSRAVMDSSVLFREYYTLNPSEEECEASQVLHYLRTHTRAAFFVGTGRSMQTQFIRLLRGDVCTAEKANDESIRLSYDNRTYLVVIMAASVALLLGVLRGSQRRGRVPSS